MSREMKHSGIPWIGDIPRGWAVCRIKDVASLYNGNSIKDEEKDNYTNDDNAHPYISTKDIDATYQSINYNNGLYTQKDDNTFKIAYADSSLMCIEGGSAGKKKAYVEQNVSFVNKLCCFAPDKISGKYLFYSLCSPHFESDFSKYISGLIGGVSVSTLKNLKQIVPSLEEQQKIASFLDRKCAEIDEMIALQEKIVEELKAYKQSVITEAVTKGLNPDVPMKDSGIEWIGEIPEHWEVIKFHRVCNTITDFVASGSFESLRINVPYLDTPDYAMLVRTVDLSGKGRSADCVYISKHSYDFLRNSNLFGGEVILPNIGASVGDVYIVPKLYEKMSLAPNLIMFKTSMCDNFFYYYFFSLAGKQAIYNISQSTAQPKFNKTQLKEIKVCAPPVSEQERIADYLDNKCTEIDNLISIKLSKIDSLKEYKKSIIYEYVTGKKEVTE